MPTARATAVSTARYACAVNDGTRPSTSTARENIMTGVGGHRDRDRAAQPARGDEHDDDRRREERERDDRVGRGGHDQHPRRKTGLRQQEALRPEREQTGFRPLAEEL